MSIERDTGLIDRIPHPIFEGGEVIFGGVIQCISTCLVLHVSG